MIWLKIKIDNMAFKLKNESVKKIIGELRKASKLHAGQADKLQKMIKSPLEKKNTIKENKFNVDKLADADDQKFLDRQREERVNYSELDAKGKAIYNKNRKKAGLAPLKKDKTPGSQNPNFPDVMYTKDGKAVKSTSIDEGQLDSKPSVGPKGKFVNYNENGKKTKYYYKNPKA